jgi:hypothetical protein
MCYLSSNYKLITKVVVYGIVSTRNVSVVLYNLYKLECGIDFLEWRLENSIFTL